MTESLWELPATWEWSVIGDLGDVVSGGTPSTKVPEYWGGDVVWFAPSDLTGYKRKHIAQGAKTLTAEGLAKSSAKLMAAGSVMFSSRAPVGYVAINSAPAATNQGFKSIVPRRELFNEYLYHYLKSAKHIAEARASGTTFKELSGSAFSTLPVPLAPANEQRRIVEKIEGLFDEIDKGVESLRTAKGKIDLYRQSLLKSAFEGRLTAEWREANRDKLESPDALLARIREERERRYQVALEDWERAAAEWENGSTNGKNPAKPKQPAGFDLLSTSECSPWPSVHVRALLGAPLVNGRSAKDKEGGFPVLRLTALQSGKIDLRESKEGDWSEKDAEPFLVKRDDVFVSRGNGSKKLVGIGGRVLHEPMPVAFPDTMIRVRLDTSAVQPEYFLLAWNSWTVRQQIEKAARTTAGIYKINQGHIAGFMLPLPSLTEQSEIVRILDDRLEAVDTLEAEIDANLTRADTLRQSILKKAFAGKLVPQDPDDEPAQALLARIRAARANGREDGRKRRRATAPN